MSENFREHDNRPDAERSREAEPASVFEKVLEGLFENISGDDLAKDVEAERAELKEVSSDPGLLDVLREQMPQREGMPYPDERRERPWEEMPHPDERRERPDEGRGERQYLSSDTQGESSDTGENQADADDKPEVKGGSYGDVFNNRVERGESGTDYEVHHIPADSVTDLERNDGPAIKMEKEDHDKTASNGSSKEAQAYRAEQKALIEQGKFREAVQMDIDDIREKFGDKYDEAIAEMEAYLDKLESEGKI